MISKFSHSVLISVATRLVLVLIVVASCSVYADPTSLQLRPRVCVTNAEAPSCETTIEVKYPQRLEPPFCLIMNHTQAVHCSEEAVPFLQLKVPVMSAKSVLFELQDDHGNVIAASTLQVAQHTPPKRIRRGIGWNIL
ncbi:DUF3019 domain-containing protein [Pseudidiomarina sediminum]|uniref:DUF3019 domain-containing protein n=1 Tax=Pseudidiomarina sediminum TaxID=431675 RepID=UPI000F877C44|nr:DUF3019 domain-containing protein [Pseudidiomarina sediminum]